MWGTSRSWTGPNCRLWTSSAVAAHVRTSAWQEPVRVLRGNAPACLWNKYGSQRRCEMRIFDEDGQMCLYDPAGSAGRMSPARSAAESRSTRTSGSFSRRSLELKAIPFMSLDLTPGAGNLLGEFYWELISPWHGGSSILNTGPAPLKEEDVYSLSQILQAAPPRRYYLSRTACLGILRRARERGKELPDQLKTALEAQAGISQQNKSLARLPTAFAANQRDEVRDLHDVAGALGA